MSLFKSSIGRKALMGLTGFFLFGFVIVHMLGNLQIFLGQQALNEYAEHLEELSALLWPARIFLLSTLIVHIVAAVSLSSDNKKARPVTYSHGATIQASYASRTMLMSGIIIFLFIVYHLLHFTFGVTNPEYCNLVDVHGLEDVYSMVVLSFQNIYISAAYLTAMAVLCLHLSHGVASLFQSIGIANERNNHKLGLASKGIALFIFIGNSSIPLAVLAGILRPGQGVSL